jgi:hypothetical protein
MVHNTISYCNDQKKTIDKEQKPYVAKHWSPTPVTNECRLFRLIPKDSFNFKSRRIDRDVFEDAGLSVIASGGRFSQVNPSDAIAQSNRQGLRQFVGAVEIPATTFLDGSFELKHDPHPFKYRGEMKDQHPNHVSVVCVKSAELVNKLIDAPDWAVEPPLDADSP